jgi:hypothetical protein
MSRSPPLSRRLLLLAPVALAACGEEPAAPVYPPLTYDYLVPLKLNVGQIDIDDSWVPRGASRQVEFLSPVRPRDALLRMARDRLVPAGTKGRASFVIEDASIIRGVATYQGSLAVRLDIVDDAGTRLGQAVARIIQVRPAPETSDSAIRDTLYSFTRDMMKDMNVEFEVQILKTLREMLQSTDSTAPAPAKVESEDLALPKKP